MIKGLDLGRGLDLKIVSTWNDSGSHGKGTKTEISKTDDFSRNKRIVDMEIHNEGYP